MKLDLMSRCSRNKLCVFVYVHLNICSRSRWSTIQKHQTSLCYSIGWPDLHHVSTPCEDQHEVWAKRSRMGSLLLHVCSWSVSILIFTWSYPVLGLPRLNVFLSWKKHAHRFNIDTGLSPRLERLMFDIHWFPIHMKILNNEGLKKF